MVEMRLSRGGTKVSRPKEVAPQPMHVMESVRRLEAEYPSYKFLARTTRSSNQHWVVQCRECPERVLQMLDEEGKGLFAFEKHLAEKGHQRLVARRLDIEAMVREDTRDGE